MTPERLLIANRGEIAIRVARAAAALGIRSVAVFPDDDAACLHVRKADEARRLEGSGAAAYLDAEQIARVAAAAGCDAVHPGYGFLSENARFARLCGEHGLVFVGPPPETLELLGDKSRARALARSLGIGVLEGTPGPTSLDDAHAYVESVGHPVILKAVAGGGGRGMRVVRTPCELPEAYARCRSIAESSFGSGDLYVERYVPRARHVEVQVVADAAGSVAHLWERDCTVQRRHQKLIEIAPSPFLPAPLRERIVAAAVVIAAAASYVNVGTIEFLVDLDADADAPEAFAFIEANPRLQVEHTVTEELLGVDLVRTQLLLAGGATLGEIGLLQEHVPAPEGFALEARVNLETIGADGTIRPAVGLLTAFEPPGGPGVRVDAHGYAGYRAHSLYDALIAKVIVRERGPFPATVAKAERALAELRVEGVGTNAAFLRGILRDPALADGTLTTTFVDERGAEIAARAAAPEPALFFAAAAVIEGPAAAPVDPLAPLHGPAGADGPGSAVLAPLQGTVVAIEAGEGEAVGRGTPLFVLEAMKMEHVVAAEVGGTVRQIAVSLGETVPEGLPLAFVEPADAEADEVAAAVEVEMDAIRADLGEVIARHDAALDAARPDAVARRHEAGKRTARENADDLCDPGTFLEIGPLVIANRSSRASLEELIARTPADGLVCGTGAVDGRRCAVLAYDYTVLAGTQGEANHLKTDRVLELAERDRLPVVFLTEGGGGRPGDDGGFSRAGRVPTFTRFARLSGLVPLVGIASGRCFAGNAAILGCCDVTIVTRDANLGMGGPAMIEGGGLGVFRPEEIGPVTDQVPAGTIDVLVEDEGEAVTVARRYLSYFGPVSAEWEAADQRLLRHLVPEERMRAYDVRRVVETLADTGSVLELRRGFGRGMVTALARVEGRPLGIVANDPSHLAGAIDGDAADKAARFLQLCDAFDLPVLSLCDTPGIMVGPEVERTGLVRRSSRLFVTGANLSVPLFTIVLRKAYGLGANAMAGGSFDATRFTVSWPTGEFYAMGIEGAVKLGFRRELEAIEDAGERHAAFERMVAEAFAQAEATSIATGFGIDDVIDPADSRRWVAAELASWQPPRRDGKKRSFVDTW